MLVPTFPTPPAVTGHMLEHTWHRHSPVTSSSSIRFTTATCPYRNNVCTCLNAALVGKPQMNPFISVWTCPSICTSPEIKGLYVIPSTVWPWTDSWCWWHNSGDWSASLRCWLWKSTRIPALGVFIRAGAALHCIDIGTRQHNPVPNSVSNSCGWEGQVNWCSGSQPFWRSFCQRHIQPYTQ